MLKREVTAFGLDVKVRLLKAGRTQEWLAEKVAEKTGMYVDSSNLYKIFTGQLNSPKIEAAIKEILEIERT